MGGYDENNDVKVKFTRHDRLFVLVWAWQSMLGSIST